MSLEQPFRSVSPATCFVMRPVRHLRRLALFSALTACSATVDLTGVGTGDAGVNAPVVGSTSGAFGYALHARTYSADQSYSPDLGSATLTVGLAVASYGGGAGRLEVIDATGAVVFGSALQGLIAQGSTVVRGSPPYRVRLTFDRFSGSVSLG